MKQRLSILITIYTLLFSMPTTAEIGNYDKGEEIAAMCFGCHGKFGNPIKISFPQLAGQSEEYLVNQLFNYKDGTRRSGVMKRVTKNLSKDDLTNLAAYFSMQFEREFITKKSILIDKGQSIYKKGTKYGVPACIKCHGSDGWPMDVNIPILTLQHPLYIKRKLRQFRAHKKEDVATSSEQLMLFVTKNMTNEDISAVASYINFLSISE